MYYIIYNCIFAKQERQRQVFPQTKNVKMEEIGLVKIKPLLQKTDEALIKRIASKRGILIGRVRKMMENNRFSVKQFSDLIGKTTQAVHLYLKPTIKGDSISVRLHHCYPYPDTENNGPLFIVRDFQSDKMIKESLN